MLPVDLPVDDPADKERGEYRQAGALGGGNETAEDAAEDDQRHDEGPGRIFECSPYPLQLEYFFDRIVALHRKDIGQTHHREAAEDAGNDPRHENFDHRTAGHDRVEDHWNGRGNNDSDRGRRRHNGGGEWPGVALAFHGRDQDRTQSRHISHGGAGHLGEKH